MDKWRGYGTIVKALHGERSSNHAVATIMNVAAIGFYRLLLFSSLLGFLNKAIKEGVTACLASTIVLARQVGSLWR